MVEVPVIKLNNGKEIPQLGLGLWQVKDEEQLKIAFNTAVKAGYRHFDSAQAYDNEQMLGAAWKSSSLKRQDIFITTKIHVKNFGPKHVHESFKESLTKLQTDHVNLLLLHFPVTIRRKKAWLALEEIQKSGQALSIGVSNYTIKHLDEMQSYSQIKPAVNQVELHVFLQQPELIKYCHANGITVEAYSPLARANIMDNEAVINIAEKYNKTYAQVMLRWLVEQGIVVIPKSVTPSRVEENINIFDFKLDQEDLDLLAKQDMDKRFCWSPVHIP
jgi:diketogulonate reductase-like aldo/keto reductase